VRISVHRERDALRRGKRPAQDIDQLMSRSITVVVCVL